jgi:lipopolysaccharide transport system ATP-binding protein
MSENILIKAEHLSKKFCRSLHKSLWYGMHDVLNAINPLSKHHKITYSEGSVEDKDLRPDEFWSLRDVSFEVRRGECLGLIGHNGAGKSTLLKILNGLIRPDRGRVTMRGKVAAMIELNAGFNNLLTGRENIYNQAALLGYSRQEIIKNFDAIVAFSELEQFLDMPVQNYSSGMKVKLGFAISTQLKPDILLIDEVLAVGDLGYRHKCLNRISELMKESAVIFVSHSMTQVMRISSQVLMLKSGCVAFSGTNVSEGLERYYALFGGGGVTSSGSQELMIRGLLAQNEKGMECGIGGELQAEHLDTITLRFWVNAVNPKIKNAVAQILFWNHEMIPVLDIIGEKNYGFHIDFENNRTEVEVRMPNVPLNAGRYSISVILTAPNLEKVYCQVDQAVRVQISGGSPASGAGCVLSGNWKTYNNNISYNANRLLTQRLQDGLKISDKDGLLFDELGPNDIAIDCGANIGKVTLQLAERGAVVHAFEPDPAAFEQLRQNASHFSNVILHQMAVAAKKGTLPLYFRSERHIDPVMYSVGSTLIREKTDVITDGFCEVKVERLADFLRNFDRVRLLKLDIEGAECEVLEDLIQENLLDRIDLVFVETHEEWIPETTSRLEIIRKRLAEGGYHNVFLNWI